MTCKVCGAEAMRELCPVHMAVWLRSPEIRRVVASGVDQPRNKTMLADYVTRARAEAARDAEMSKAIAEAMKKSEALVTEAIKLGRSTTKLPGVIGSDTKESK